MPQSINVVNNPDFRDLLLYTGHGICTEDDIPHQTKLTDSIIEAWKQERKEFVNNMKVHPIMPHFTYYGPAG